MQTIEIRTSQNVAIEYELASLRDRGLGLFIDLVIIGFVTLLLVIILGGALSNSNFRDNLLTFILIVVPLFGFLAYMILFETFGNGQTPGKYVIGIRVIRIDGQDPVLSDYFLRAVFHLVETLLCTGILSAIVISSSPYRQRIGDHTAGTTVIRVRNNFRTRLADILRINSLDNYEPVYPQVRTLSESDMLIIKQALNRSRTIGNQAHDDLIYDLALHLKEVLEIKEHTNDATLFLKTLLKDYIVLTR
jgi:uncharacterized RDD family membrane protein YckC